MALTSCLDGWDEGELTEFLSLRFVPATDCKRKASGADYKGKVTKTISGYTCQSWSSQKPHKHPYRVAAKFADKNIKLAGNYCRNPSNSKQPWCLTTNPKKRWEYCNIPDCPKVVGKRPFLSLLAY
jgi:integrin beta 3